MIMSSKMLQDYRKMMVTRVDSQILFLCEKGLATKLVANDILLQQFKTARFVQDDRALKILTKEMLQRFDNKDIAALEDLDDFVFEKQANFVIPTVNK